MLGIGAHEMKNKQFHQQFNKALTLILSPPDRLDMWLSCCHILHKSAKPISKTSTPIISFLFQMHAHNHVHYVETF